jgi:hypothetical protein
VFRWIAQVRFELCDDLGHQRYGHIDRLNSAVIIAITRECKFLNILKIRESWY